MTNEQLTQEIVNLKEHQAKAEAEHEKFEMIVKELQEDVKTTKSLAEDVHILAINMENMQKTMDETNRKVDALNFKEFTEYKENKKLVKQNIISAVVGAFMGFGLSLIAWLVRFFMMTGGE
nr:MAG TPA: hypothetical protein [Caudoviricetes sp.]